MANRRGFFKGCIALIGVAAVAPLAKLALGGAPLLPKVKSPRPELTNDHLKAYRAEIQSAMRFKNLGPLCDERLRAAMGLET